MTDTFASGISLRAALKQATVELTSVDAAKSRRDAELLLFHVAAITRIELITDPDRLLSEAELRRYWEVVARRKAEEPIQHITGEREFYGLRFVVTPDVLIPRPETELLVEAALERISLEASARVVDVGTGSGAIAVALAVARPRAKITAVDISTAALQIARQNASAHQVARQIEFVEADLLTGFGAPSVDMIVSNPPYIASGEREMLDVEVRGFEPATALFAGPTGLEVYERLVPQAAVVLRPGGWLLMEIGASQQLQLQRLLKAWDSVSFVDDLQGIPRVALAQRA